MTNWIETLKNGLKELDAKTEYANYCDKLFEENPLDEEIEAKFDKAYEAEYNAFIHCINALKHIIDIDDKTARAMITTQRTQINNLLARWEA